MSGGAVISTNFCAFFVLVVISADSASGYFDEYYDSSLPSSSYEYEDNLLKDLEWGFKLGSAPPGKPHSTVKTDIVNRFELGSTEHTPQQVIKTSDRKSETNYDFYQDYEENILLLPTAKPKKRQFVPTRITTTTGRPNVILRTTSSRHRSRIASSSVNRIVREDSRSRRRKTSNVEVTSKPSGSGSTDHIKNAQRLKNHRLVDSEVDDLPVKNEGFVPSIRLPPLFRPSKEIPTHPTKEVINQNAIHYEDVNRFRHTDIPKYDDYYNNFRGKLKIIGEQVSTAVPFRQTDIPGEPYGGQGLPSGRQVLNPLPLAISVTEASIPPKPKDFFSSFPSSLNEIATSSSNKAQPPTRGGYFISGDIGGSGQQGYFVTSTRPPKTTTIAATTTTTTKFLFTTTTQTTTQRPSVIPSRSPYYIDSIDNTNQPTLVEINPDDPHSWPWRTTRRPHRRKPKRPRPPSVPSPSPRLKKAIKRGRGKVKGAFAQFYKRLRRKMSEVNGMFRRKRRRGFRGLRKDSKHQQRIGDITPPDVPKIDRENKSLIKQSKKVVGKISGVAKNLSEVMLYLTALNG